MHSFFQKGTQHDVDEHRGKSLIKAFLDLHMIKNRAIVIDRIVPGTLEKAVVGGKAVKNPVVPPCYLYLKRHFL